MSTPETPRLRRLVLIALALSLGAAVSLGITRFAYGLLLPVMRDDLARVLGAAGVPIDLNKPFLDKDRNVVNPLPDDVATLKGFWKNPVSRTLLVAILSGLGTAIGMWVGAAWIATLL